MSEKSDAIVGRVREMITTIEDPNELRRELEKMLTEQSPPRAIFADGEVMPFHEFERRFKAGFLGGNETRFAQWKVEIHSHGGELCLGLGISAEGKMNGQWAIDGGNVEP